VTYLSIFIKSRKTDAVVAQKLHSHEILIACIGISLQHNIRNFGSAPFDIRWITSPNDADN
jgi:hypothetical protein